MLARLTSKNRITLPESVLSSFEGTEYFDVANEKGRIVLTPLRLAGADVARAKLTHLGLSESDVTDAVAWARRR